MGFFDKLGDVIGGAGKFVGGAIGTAIGSAIGDKAGHLIDGVSIR